MCWRPWFPRQHCKGNDCAVAFDYPVFLDLRGKRCLVTGYGWPAAEKIQGLVRGGADVTYLNAELPKGVQELVSLGQIKWVSRDYQRGDLEGYFLVIAVNDDRSKNAPVHREADEKNILFNAVDDPSRCGFAFGSVHRQGDLTIAISTSGNCPALAVRLREQLEEIVGPEYAELVEMLGELRTEIAERVPDFTLRKELWYRLVDSGALNQIAAGDAESARQRLRLILEKSARQGTLEG
jgi:siroheme synthase-like protein